MFISQFYEQLGNLLFGATLKAFLQANNLPEIAHFDLYEKQPFREATEIAYSLPAVFLESKLLNSESIAGGIEEKYLLRLHIESKNFGSTAYHSHNRTESLTHLKLTEALKLFLQKEFPQFKVASLSLDQRGTNTP
ncbi:MAG: hypothetical protein N2235_26465, partial [Fischerella sp.]|nr:hypothetical protein [Fischerella sp.]